MAIPADRSRSVLVAGVGNIFLGDDGFGSEVARRLAGRVVPDGVRVVDYGIGGIHLAYDLLDGPDLLVLVDAVDHGQVPGTVSVIEVDLDGLGAATLDSHSMDPAAVLANVRRLGGMLPPTLIVACQPADSSDRIGLTPPVQAALEQALDAVLRVVAENSSPHATRDATMPPATEEQP